MSDVDGPETGDELGPIDFFVVEFPDGRLGVAGFRMLLDLADRGVIQILDLEFIAKTASGDVTTVDVSEVAGGLICWSGTGRRQDCSTRQTSLR